MLKFNVHAIAEDGSVIILPTRAKNENAVRKNFQNFLNAFYSFEEAGYKIDKIDKLS